MRPAPPTGFDEVCFNETRDIIGSNFATLLGHFLEEAEGYICALEDGMRTAATPRSFTLPAHTLKSSAAQFGFVLMSDHAKSIESLSHTAADGSVARAQMAPYLASLRSAFADASRYLNHFLQ